MREPLLLLLETATEVCSIGVARGRELLGLQESPPGQDHAAIITLYIEAVMEQAGHALAELDAIVVSDGPGSYTSLRIGAATAKGICFALQKPLLAVDTLQSLAEACKALAPGCRAYCPMIDARRMEVYTALFDEALRRLWDTQAMVLRAEMFQGVPNPVAICGSGAAKALPLFAQGGVHHISLKCSATYLIAQALNAWHRQDFQDIAYYVPMYLKPPNITIPKPRISPA